MAAAVRLRSDHDEALLRRLEWASKDAGQNRRLLALAAVYDGESRSAAARKGGVSLQSIRDWVVRFNAEGPDGLIDRKAPGPATRLNDDQRRALKDRVEQGPIPAAQASIMSASRDESDISLSASQRWASSPNVPSDLGLALARFFYFAGETPSSTRFLHRSASRVQRRA